MDPIPDLQDPERYVISSFTHSPFVEIRSGEMFVVEMQYPLLGMQNATHKCYVRKEVYDMLMEAARKLPEGYRFKMLDTWRPFALQKELYDKYSVSIIREFEMEDMPEEQQKMLIRKFVSDPVPDKDVPPVHTTGGAVDLTIVDESGEELPMGTVFDAFTNKTNTSFFEGEKDMEIRNNRRMLYNAMISSGFTNLPSEWWHYDFGDRFWAYYTGKAAIYEGVFEEGDIYV